MPGEYLDPSQWPLWMQSGSIDAPQERTMPQDLYTSRFRKVQQEHPAPWQQEDMDRAVGMGLSAAMPMGWMMKTPLLATAFTMNPTEAAAGEPDQVMALQTKLQKQGLYNGPIDGIIKPGGPTERALKAAQETERMRLQQEQAAAQTASAGAQQASAQAQLAESQRRQAEMEARNQQREQGNQRMNEMENNLSPISRAIRDYSTPLGVLAGAAIGGLTRGKVVGASNRASAAGAAEAEGVMAGKAAGLPGRAARANEFWRRGGGEVPFLPTPGQAPGVAANPGMTPASGLYAPSTRANFAKDAGIMGGFGAESAVGQAYLVPHAQEELRAANEAASADPSEINIRRLQAAKDNASIMEGLMNFGRAGAGGYGLGALKMQRTNAVPNMSKAENELLAIQEMLRKKGGGSIPMQQAPMLPVGMPPAFAGAGATRARVR